VRTMKSVWLLCHVHAFDDGHEDVKLIGVFETAAEAANARARIANLAGFKDSPEGFSIDEHRLGVIGWLEGYVTLNDDT